MRAFISCVCWIFICTAEMVAQTGPTECRLVGEVKRAGSDSPIAKANLRIVGEAIPEAKYEAISDAEGKFDFPKIECGRYYLYLSRNGFVPKRFNASLFAERNSQSVVEVRAGEAAHATVEMLPNPAIVGRIADADGEPVRGISVSAITRRYLNGKLRLAPMLNAVGFSNDLGEYRIVDLPPGEYYLRAYMRTPIEGSGQQQALQARLYAETFYPGTTDVDNASPVHATAGDETHADITLEKAGAVTVQGKVTGADEGESVLMLFPKGAAMSGVRRARTEEDSFSLTSIPPGKYWLLALNGQERSTGGIPVEVGSQDIKGLEIQLKKPYDIQGKVTVHSAKADPFFTGIVVDLDPQDEHYTSFFPSNAQVAPNGRFDIRNQPPGNVRVRAGTIAGYKDVENYYFEDAKINGRSVIEDGFDLGAFTSPVQLEVIMNDAGARLDGSVTDENGKPFAAATVVLVPNTHKQRKDLYATAVADQSGRFSIPGIAPGEYKLYAWENSGANPVNEESAPYLDQGFVSKYEAKGVALSLKAKGHENKTVKVIRIESE